MDKTKQLSFFLIDLMKSAIKKEDLLKEKTSELILQIGKEIDRCKVNKGLPEFGVMAYKRTYVPFCL